MNREEIESMNQAMGAIALIRDHYASGAEGQRLAQEILKMLRGNGKSLFRLNMANALEASLENKAIEIVARKAA